MLKLAEANLSALIESTHDLIWSVDLNYRLISFNSAFQQNIQNTYGVRLTEGMCFHEVLPAERAALWPVFYAHVLAEGPFRLEYTRIDGGIMELAFNPIVVDGETTGISIFGKDITEQKAAEESRRFLAEVVESCEEGIITNAPSGEILTWNHGAEAIYGYTAEEAIGKPFFMIIAPERRAKAERVIGHLLDGGSLLLDDGEGLRKDGSKFHVTVTTWPIRNSAGEVSAICTIVRDVSVRHEAENNRALLASVVESSGDLINTINMEGNITSWNPGAERITGYTSEEILGKNAAIIVPRGHEEEVWQNLGTIREGCTIGPVDTVMRRKDGSGIDVSLTLTPIRNSDGEVVGAAAIARDISQRKQAEMQLRDSEERYRATFEQAAVGIVHASLEGQYLRCNARFAEIIGYPPEEVPGLSFQQITAPQYLESSVEPHRQLCAGAAEIPSMEKRYVRKDGSLVWARVTLSSQRDGEGRVLYFIAIVEEIQARKEAEAALRESLDSLKESQEIGGLGSYVLDIGNGVWTGSDVLDKIFGIDKEYERTVAGWTALLHPDDRALISAYLAEEIIRQGQNFNREYRIIRQTDKAERWVHGIGRLELGDKGQPVKMLGVIKDITERKMSEMKLCESEERYRTVFQTSPDAVIIARLSDGVILDINRSFQDSTGFARDEAIGRTVVQLGLWENDSDKRIYFEQLSQQGTCREMEVQSRRKNGELFWMRLSASLLEIGGERCRITFAKDISAAKAAEERLAAATKALRLSEERYRTVFQTSADSISISRIEDGMFVDINPAFCRIHGFERDEVIGRTSSELHLWVNPEDRQRMVNVLRENTFCRDMECLQTRKNGEIFWVLISGTRIEIDGVPSILIVVRDISEIKAATQALRQSEERYRTAFQTSQDAITINRHEDGAFIDCNQSFLNTMGYKREEVLGRTTRELGIWANPRDRLTMQTILSQNSRCQGMEIQFKKKNGEVFWGEMTASQMDVDGVPCILSITRDLSAAKTAEKTIRSLAFYDPLTGLPNRRHLLERLRHPLDAGARGGRSKALLLIDLDHFKTLNDTLGHQTGDLLLQEVARRVLACAHESDTVCRLGGDEFVILLEDQSKMAEEAAAQGKAVGEKVLDAIDQPFLIEDHESLFTASIGIAVFEDRQDNTDEILQQAEIALYQAKAAGRNTLRLFSPVLQAAVNARATLEEDLRQGIKTKQFLLYYQPQVELGRLTGAEALVRWMHPRRGMVQPNDFIPLAEESRLILPLGDWVLEDACKQIALWAGRKETAHLSVAVNISALQFRQPSFVEQVLATIYRTGANPGSLRLELTESMLVENLEDIIAKMTELRSYGLRFSLDDFGTGYSSLTYLKRLPLDRLKIDRSFVRDMMVDATSGAIAQTILSLGRALGISVIAEGVETEEQRGYLAGLGCHSFQGFLFSRPLPLDKFEAFLQDFTEHGGQS
jgi:diguanylate cyclase (GGDEF)-like protein/PAS domain S-box-containing protein